MSGKQMEGDNRERRKKAKEARDRGEKASENSATLGASDQTKRVSKSDTHEQRLDQKDEGKTPSARKGWQQKSPRGRDHDDD